MANCELCGYSGNLIKAIIEGSLLNVCENCAKFGKAIILKQQPQQKIKPVKHKITELINIINPDYSKLIKESREKLGMKQEDLAKKIDEKTSIIHKLETGHLQPTISLAKKLERTLSIRLIEIYEEVNDNLNFKDKELTIGDLINSKN
jgi:putative transcription factor